MPNLIGCASLRYVVIRNKSGRMRQFPGLDTPRFKEVSGDRFSLIRKKSELGKIRFLTRGGHVAFHGTWYSWICPYSQRIRVRIVGFPGHDTSFFTQCQKRDSSSPSGVCKRIFSSGTERCHCTLSDNSTCSVSICGIFESIKMPWLPWAVLLIYHL